MNQTSIAKKPIHAVHTMTQLP